MTDYLGAPRFKVTELEGYNDSRNSGHNVPRTSFAVVDRAYCCAIVWTNYVGNTGKGPLWSRRSKAHAACDALNAKYAA